MHSKILNTKTQVEIIKIQKTKIAFCHSVFSQSLYSRIQDMKKSTTIKKRKTKLAIHTYLLQVSEVNRL